MVFSINEDKPRSYYERQYKDFQSSNLFPYIGFKLKENRSAANEDFYHSQVNCINTNRKYNTNYKHPQSTYKISLVIILQFQFVRTVRRRYKHDEEVRRTAVLLVNKKREVTE